MTIKKKLTAAILAGIMMLSASFSGFAAVAGDVIDSPYEEAIETLGALKIMIGDDDGKFRPDATIRRSEFAKVAVMAMGLGDVANASSYQTKYPDVVENHWANGYINVATEQGIVIGDDEGNFRPDDSISYAEAMTVLVRMIGHEPSALSKGGFPTGYMVVGSQNGISKNAVAGADVDVIRGMVAQMTFNALTVKMMEQTGFGNNEKYEIVDKTLLYDVLGVTKGIGQISAVGISSISGTSSLKDNEVRIGDKTYTVSESALPVVRNLLGFTVVYYVQEQADGDFELILARADKNRNHAITVTADNVESVSASGENTRVQYWENKETDKTTKDLFVKMGAQMIFNGKAVTFDAELLSPASGRTVFLDIDNDDLFDMVFVTSFQNIVVESVIASSHKVTDKYGSPSLVLDPDDKDVKFTMTKSGQIISLSDLSEWDVLSVAKSSDGKIISIEVSSDRVSGKVTEIHDEKVVIDGKSYGVAANYQEEIKLNDEGTFYLDVEGNIAAVDAKSILSSNYAYAVDGALTTGFNPVLQIKLFTKEGEIVILKSGDKIRFNGTIGTTPLDVLSALKDGSGNFVPQLVTFEKNAEGEISSLNTATDLDGGIDKTKFAQNASGSMVYKKTSGKLGVYNINENTLILNIPAGETDPEEFAIEKLSFFDDNESYDAIIFDAGEDLTAKVVIVTSAAASASTSAPLAIVDRIATVNNANNEIVQKLYAYQNGKLVSFETESDGILVTADGEGVRALVRGDIIQLKLNTKNEISGIRVLFEAEDKATEFTSTIDDLTLVYGRVIKKFASSINVQVNDGSILNYSLNDVTVYELNTQKNTGAIRVVDANEITQYDELDESRVLVKIYKDAVSEIVIVK